MFQKTLKSFIFVNVHQNLYKIFFKLMLMHAHYTENVNVYKLYSSFFLIDTILVYKICKLDLKLLKEVDKRT
jgi:hypothetical protein